MTEQVVSLNTEVTEQDVPLNTEGCQHTMNVSSECTASVLT